MRLITLFEHQRITYADLGWGPDSIYPDLLDRLNESSSDEVIRVGRKSIKATQYVGVLRVGDFSIQILPKIDFDQEGDAESVSGSLPRTRAELSAMRNLLQMLAYSEGIELREKIVTGLETQRGNWFELLTRFFALELHTQFLHGPYRAYVRKEESLPVMRGKWLLARQFSRNPHIHNRFELAFDEFTIDTRLNQLFRYVVERLLVLTEDRINHRLLQTVQTWLVDVQRLGEFPPGSLDNIAFDRLNERFRVSFNYARMVIENLSLMLEGGRTQAFAFVFDMNRLFERFVCKFMQRFDHRIFSTHEPLPRITAQAQGRLVYLLRRDPDQKQFIWLKPDVLISRASGGIELVLDTKYKDLDLKPDGLSLSEGDLYQMLAYMVRFECRHSMLLYPASRRRHPLQTNFRIPGEDRVVHVASIDLHQPLADPRPLIADFASIFKRISWEIQ